MTKIEDEIETSYGFIPNTSNQLEIELQKLIEKGDSITQEEIDHHIYLIDDYLSQEDEAMRDCEEPKLHNIKED